MKTILFMIFILSVFYGQSYAISEAEFQKLYKSSSVLQKADDFLNQTWKEVSSDIPKQDMKSLLSKQREWLKTGRDESAEEYLVDGYSPGCAYAIATIRWAKNLRVIQYNYNLSEEDMARGIAKADDAFWDGEADIPEECKKE